MTKMLSLTQENAATTSYKNLSVDEIYDIVIKGLKAKIKPMNHVPKPYLVSIISENFSPSFHFSFFDQAIANISLEVKKTRNGVIISVASRNFSNLLDEKEYYPETYKAIQEHKKSYEIFLQRWKSGFGNLTPHFIQGQNTSKILEDVIARLEKIMEAHANKEPLFPKLVDLPARQTLSVSVPRP